MIKSSKQNLITAGVLVGILGIVLFLFMSSPKPQNVETNLETTNKEMNEETMVVKNLLNTDRKLTLFESEYGNPYTDKNKNLVGSEIEKTTVLMDIKKQPINYVVEGIPEVLTLNPKDVFLYYFDNGNEIAGVYSQQSRDFVYKRDGKWAYFFGTQMDTSCEELSMKGMDRESTIILNCYEFDTQQYRK